MPAPKIGFTRMLRRSLTHRTGRAVSALIALTVSAAVATALLTLYASLDAKLHHEFRSFGANIVLTAPDLQGREYDAQQAAGPGAHVAPFAYAVATTDRGTPVVVVGTEFAAVRELDPWWQVSIWPATSTDGLEHGVLLGSKAAEFVGNEKQVTLHYAGNTATFVGPVGHLTTGSDEDSRIYLSLRDFTALTLTDIPPEGGTRGTTVKPSVLEIQVPGGAAQVEQALTRLRTAFPQATVAPVRQLVDGESSIVDKTHALMFGAVLLIALTVAISVLATLSASVLERRRDFALMKALGGSESQLMGLFLSETLLLAITGVVAGWLLGSVAAWVISEANFHTPTLPRIGVLPAVFLLNLLIAAAAALFPVRALRNLQPAALLKGE